MFFYAKYITRENSYFSELLPSRGFQKPQNALKLLGFLYGSSSIHWPPKPILSSSIFSHLFPFKFFPLHLHLNLHILSKYIFTPYFFVIKKFLSSPSLEKNFFTSDSLPAQIPRILYHRPSLNPLILSLNKYSQSRIILEIPSYNHRQIYFPELLKPTLDNISLLCYNIAREPE